MDAELYFDADALELCQVDQERGRARQYWIARCHSLFDEPSLGITWGRIGRAPRLRLETFPDGASRDARWKLLLRRRAAHGYRVVAACADVPHSQRSRSAGGRAQ
jgi:predicted DNA-binding WGR domain protein